MTLAQLFYLVQIGTTKPKLEMTNLHRSDTYTSTSEMIIKYLVILDDKRDSENMIVQHSINYM